MDRAIFVLGVVLSVVGLLDAALGGYWLYQRGKGVTPVWFTERTKHMAAARQQVLATCLLIAGAAVAAAGLAILLSPDMRNTVNAALR